MVPMLKITDLKVSTEDKNTRKVILNGLNLTINPGEVHAIMGPNGSGKTTLANTLSRNENYQVDSGEIDFLGKSILESEPEECAQNGMFLSFQYPVAIPGVSTIHFLKAAVNACRKAQGKAIYDAVDFLKLAKQKANELNMDQDFLYRPINQGFSGGEKKRNEILQMLLLEPKLSILDETDSGLDIDALKDVAKGVNAIRSANTSFLIITHYQRLLDYITPDFVHVMSEGKIIYSGDKNLPQELEAKGYGWLKEQAAG